MEFLLGNPFFLKRYTLSLLVGMEMDKRIEEPTQERLRCFPEGKAILILKI